MAYHGKARRVAPGDNHPPVVRWTRVVLGCGGVRHRLFVDGRETDWFVDDESRAGRGHCFSRECPVSLYAAGRGREIRCRDGSTYRIAASVGHFPRVGDAKARAETCALSPSAPA